MGVPKVATVWFEGCSGCHMSFLDLDEDLVSILSKVELTFSPITDFKDYAFPELDVGIIEGGIGNEEHLEVAHKLRKHCKILVAWGDCAVFGGVNTLRNWIPKAEVLRRGYVETESTVRRCDPDSRGTSAPPRQGAPCEPGGSGGCVCAGLPALSGGAGLQPCVHPSGKNSYSSKRNAAL